MSKDKTYQCPLFKITKESVIIALIGLVFGLVILGVSLFQTNRQIVAQERGIDAEVDAKIPDLEESREVAASTVVPKVEYHLAYPGILPDHKLYWLKMIRDRVWGWLITDAAKKAEFYLLMADKRIGAAEALLEGGKASLGEVTASKAGNYFLKAVDKLVEAKENGKDVESLEEKLMLANVKHQQVLEELLVKASDEVKNGLLATKEHVQQAANRLVSLEGGMQEESEEEIETEVEEAIEEEASESGEGE